MLKALQTGYGLREKQGKNIVIRFTNSLTRQKELIPRTAEAIKFYSCGPTVSGPLHIGNLRAALVADLIARSLRFFGYPLVYAQNLTDVDDKIIQKAIEQGTTAQQVAQHNTALVLADFAAVRCCVPDYHLKATASIAEMITMIQTLIQKGFAYEASGISTAGDVFFSVRAYADYGKLSGQNPEQLARDVRIQNQENKRDSADFALWKSAKPGEPSWESPWGKGRPGWHIECSAMAMQALGPQLDLHHGGEDLIFPHHENEIAQSECATGKKPFSKVWVHHAFLTIEGHKMSKSLGNIVLARDWIQTHGWLLTRFLLLHVHYRSILDYSPLLVTQCHHSLVRIFEAKKWLEETATEALLPACATALDSMQESMKDDLNTPEMLGHLFTYVREINRLKLTPSTNSSDPQLLKPFLLFENLILGGPLSSSEALELLEHTGSLQEAERQEIEALLSARNEARKAKDFAQSDRIRDLLLKKGIAIKDTPEKTVWKKI